MQALYHTWDSVNDIRVSGLCLRTSRIRWAEERWNDRRLIGAIIVTEECPTVPLNLRFKLLEQIPLFNVRQDWVNPATAYPRTIVCVKIVVLPRRQLLKGIVV